MSKEQNVQVFQSAALTRRLLNEDAMKTKGCPHLSIHNSALKGKIIFTIAAIKAACTSVQSAT